jgi:hypothetical protein
MLLGAEVRSVWRGKLELERHVQCRRFLWSELRIEFTHGNLGRGRRE